MYITTLIKKFESNFDVNELYQRSFIHVVLWAWITALRMAAGWKRKDAIASFQSFFRAEEIDHYSIATQYHRTNRMYRKKFSPDALDDHDDDLITISRKELTELIKSVVEETPHIFNG